MATQPLSTEGINPHAPLDEEPLPTFIDDDEQDLPDLDRVPAHVSVTNLRREFGWQDGEPLDNGIEPVQKGS